MRPVRPCAISIVQMVGEVGKADDFTAHSAVVDIAIPAILYLLQPNNDDESWGTIRVHFRGLRERLSLLQHGRTDATEALCRSKYACRPQ